MDNALLNEDESDLDKSEYEKARLTRLIEAIDGLLQNKDWQVLHELHFSREEERIKRLLLSATQESPIDVDQLHILQGEMRWAKRYANMKEWAKLLKNQLIKSKHG